jgi:hypothetical protein
MHNRLMLILRIGILLFIPLYSVNALPGMGGWGSIHVLASGWWYSLDTNADATRVVFLDPFTTSGTGDGAEFFYDRRVMLSEYANGAWSEPVVIANNAIYRPNGWMPVTTLPMISADGSTIAYLGCTGGCKPFSASDRFDIFISTRGLGGWSQPVVVPTITDELSERLSLSTDGSSLAFGSSLSDLGGSRVNQVYVVERHAGIWGAPVALPSDGIYGGSYPILARDGRQVIWYNNLPGGVSGIVSSDKLAGGEWSPPQTIVSEDITTRITHFRYTADGSAIFYWKITISASMCTSQELMVIRRSAAGWNTPQKVNGSAMIPKRCDGEAPAALNADGTRVIYPHSIVVGDVLTSDFLEVVEFKNGTWTSPTAITSPTNYYSFPRLSDNGQRLVSLGTDTTGSGYGAVIWIDVIRKIYLPLIIK